MLQCPNPAASTQLGPEGKLCPVGTKPRPTHVASMGEPTAAPAPAHPNKAGLYHPTTTYCHLLCSRGAPCYAAHIHADGSLPGSKRSQQGLLETLVGTFFFLRSVLSKPPGFCSCKRLKMIFTAREHHQTVIPSRPKGIIVGCWETFLP